MRVITCCVVIAFSVELFADGGSRKQHESEMISLQQREIVAREQIAQEQTRIESLKRDIQNVASELLNASNEKFSLLGVDETGLKGKEQELTALKSTLEAFSSSDPSILIQNKSQIDQIKLQVEQFKGQKLAHLKNFAAIIRSCDDLLKKFYNSIESYEKELVAAQSTPQSENVATLNTKSAIPAQAAEINHVDTWVVKSSGGRESLYKIAGYPEVYGNSDKWLLIYKANKDLIDKNYQQYLKLKPDETGLNAQDVLFPGQTLKIPR